MTESLGEAPRLFASIVAVNKSDNAGSLRGRLFGVLFFFSPYDHGANLYGFMTYLEAATETKGLGEVREYWAGFYAKSL
ncbi:hypothetical protein [Dechloromonas sp. A34]|uniref:hypothetical protein n=1 Tax=Dechloromonas sp. A34 TaxID=447588 RepID=UPI0022494773|nr:hypothetical protein [Dechloromonas sp. A34]